ncbi:hypothetical protein Fmac_032546 [Flemingia macrophylla]|uniref:Reverse transcriptase n=1 Tax=Flemingia macrophylla TaxID=520843 RepID=A0ABD1L577_9FABA
MDLIRGASLPNRPAYRSNPKETKEIQRQVEELMQKRRVRESLSPFAMPVILVPKNDGTSRICTDCRIINNITIRLEEWVSPDQDTRMRRMENCIQDKIWFV